VWFRYSLESELNNSDPPPAYQIDSKVFMKKKLPVNENTFLTVRGPHYGILKFNFNEKRKNVERGNTISNYQKNSLNPTAPDSRTKKGKKTNLTCGIFALFCVCRRNCSKGKLLFLSLFFLIGATGVAGLGKTFGESNITLKCNRENYYPFMIKNENILTERLQK